MCVNGEGEVYPQNVHRQVHIVKCTILLLYLLYMPPVPDGCMSSDHAYILSQAVFTNI